MPSRRPTPLQLFHQVRCPDIQGVLIAKDDTRLCQPPVDALEAIADLATVSPKGDKELPVEKKIAMQGICRDLSSNRITCITQNKIVVDYNPFHRQASLKVHSLFTPGIGAIIRTMCPMLAPS
ncbi:hypothetical protein C1H46_012629 [Malus baccata]|uniref:Uncharacterized protein n=1 Tax=Malus baccata TaxID=106549 RepID=A0A540MSR2_MALBA|nr:hypothetical protein C1H46_012629 [Malus baccata]